MNFHMPNPGFSFSSADRIHLNGIPCVYVKDIEDGALFKAMDGSERVDFYTYERIAELAKDRNRYKFEPQFYTRAGQVKRVHGYEHLFSDMTPLESALFLGRVRLMELIALELSDEPYTTDKRIEAAIDAAHDRMRVENKKKDGQLHVMPKRPALTTYKDWRRKLEELDGNPIALMDRRKGSGNRTERFDPDQLQLMMPSVVGYMCEARPSMLHQYGCMLSDFFVENQKRHKQGLLGIEPPSRSAFCRRIKKIDAFLKYALRHGIAEANKKFRSMGKGLGVIQPGRRSEIDGWEVELQTLVADLPEWKELSEQERKKLKTRRIKIIVIIDAATRCVTGIHLGLTEDTDGALAGFRLSVENKDELAKNLDLKSPWPMYSGGTMSSDNGVYVSDEASLVALDAFGGVQRAVVGVPWLRGRIERFFKTIAQKFLAFFTGRTFSNTVEKGDYDSEARASITEDELRDLLIQWIVDVYHHDYHDGIGMTPYKAWFVLGEKNPPPPPMDQGRIAAIFGVIIDRHVHGDGVHFWKQKYNSEDLQLAMRRIGVGELVRMRVDTSNLGAVAVEVPVNEKGEFRGNGPFNRKGWLVVPGPEDLNGVTFWQLKQVRKALLARFDRLDIDSEEIRLATIAEIKAWAQLAAKRRLTDTAPSAKALEAAAAGYFPGLPTKAVTRPDDLETSFEVPVANAAASPAAPTPPAAEQVKVTSRAPKAPKRVDQIQIFSSKDESK